MTTHKQTGRPRNSPGIEFSGHALRVRRTMQRLTGKDLGNLVGLSSTTISDWERDYHAPNHKQVQELAGALDCTPKDFIE